VFSGDTNATVYYMPGTTGWGPTFGGLPVLLWTPPVPFNYTISSGTITITKYTGPGGAVTIPDTIKGRPVTSIGDSAFFNCPSLTSVTIPNSVTSLGDNALAYCPHLTNVSVPDSVTSIGSFAFQFSGMTNATIGNGVTNIGRYAFYYCRKLTSVTIGTSVTTISDSVFAVCSSLTLITIPNSVTYMGDAVFGGCSSLLRVTIPNGITSIGRSEFGGCTSLTSVTIPNSVTNIGYGAFALCPNLTGVYFEGNAPSLGTNLFTDDNSVIVYYLPGTTGWTPQVQTSDGRLGVRTNQFGFTITGTSGLAVVVDASTNLASPVWSPVQTIALTGSSSYFSDPQWTNYPARFYRLGEATIGGFPTVLWNPQVQVASASFGVRTNRFGFTITGTSNLVIVVEASTNLANPLWSPVGTNTLTGGSAYFSDAQWTNYPRRFYRLRSP
jgi:hypothetical protein